MPESKEGIGWLHKVMSVVHDGVVVIQDEDIIMVNGAFAEMLDYESGELEDILFEDLVDPLSKRHDSKMLEALVTGEDPSKFNTRLVAKNGDVVQVEITPTTIELDGHPAVLAGVRDLSRQIALETAVTELENRFATLYDMSPIAYFTINRSGKIEQVNEAAESLLGCGAEDIIGRPFSDFIPQPKKDYDASADIVREVLRGKSVRGIEFEMMQQDGKIIWANVSSRALSSGTERPNEIGLMAFDVSRRKASEQRLREESQRANLYLDVMTSDLNIISQNALFAIEDLRTSEGLSDRVRSGLDETSWNIRRASRMIANMRVLISLEPPDKAKTDILPHIKKAIREVGRDFDWKKTLTADLDISQKQFEIVGHAFLWNVFFNILHNSMMYDDNEEVIVDIHAEASDLGRMVRIEFADRGCGIPDDVKRLVFKRFDNPDAIEASQGLGLAVVDHFVTDFSGRIWVEDRISGDHSQGCKIVIVLPLWEEDLGLPSILFYKSEHCVFCGPALEMLLSILDEMGIGRSIIELVNIDDPESGVSEDDLPALPTIRLGKIELTGFVPEDDLRQAVVRMIMLSGGAG